MLSGAIDPGKDSQGKLVSEEGTDKDPNETRSNEQQNVVHPVNPPPCGLNTSREGIKHDGGAGQGGDLGVPTPDIIDWSDRGVEQVLFMCIDSCIFCVRVINNNQIKLQSETGGKSIYHKAVRIRNNEDVPDRRSISFLSGKHESLLTTNHQ